MVIILIMNVFRYIHKWENENNPLIFYTFPMIHIGEKEYFEKVANLCNDLNMILVEGVSLGSKTDIGKYRSTAKLFCLKNQFDYLKFDEDIPILNIDIEKETFRKKLEKINIFVKLFYMNIFHTMMKIQLN